MQKIYCNTALFCYSITICTENKLKVFRSFIHGIYTYSHAFLNREGRPIRMKDEKPELFEALSSLVSA